MSRIHRGDIYYVTRNYSEAGSEQQAGRPAIVVSNDINNANSDVVEVVYLTTQPKNDLPTHCQITSTGRDSIALCEQVQSVFVDRLDSFIAQATPDEMQAIDRCLLASLDLARASTSRSSRSTCTSAGADEWQALKAERDFFADRYNELLDRLINTRR